MASSYVSGRSVHKLSQLVLNLKIASYILCAMASGVLLLEVMFLDIDFYPMGSKMDIDEALIGTNSVTDKKIHSFSYRRSSTDIDQDPLCQPSTWNKLGYIVNFTENGNRQDSTSPPPCNTYIKLEQIPNGRDNPMHNFHDTILPYLFFTRLCTHDTDSVSLPFPKEAIATTIPRYGWMMYHLVYPLEAMVASANRNAYDEDR